MLRKCVGILLGLFLISGIVFYVALKNRTVPVDISDLPNEEKFRKAVRVLDCLEAETHSTNLEGTEIFNNFLPKSNRIKDHLAFFQDVHAEAIRIFINRENHIYFSFLDDRLRALGGTHFVRGDVLVISYVTTDLSDEAVILSRHTTFGNGSFL